MIKQKPDEIAKRNVTTFYYPDKMVADYLMKETAYRGKNVKGGESLFYHETDDAHWLNHEAIKAISSVATLFTRLMYGLPMDRVIFHKEIEEHKAAGFAINDNTGKIAILTWFDKQIGELYEVELLNKWMIEKGIDAGLGNIITGLTMAINRKLHLLLREQRDELVYPDKDADKWPVDYKQSKTEYLKQDNDELP